MVAVLGLFGSLDGSVQGFVDDVAGSADLEVSAVSDEGFDERIFFDIAQVRGVEAAIPALRSRALVGGSQVIIVGVDERARRLGTRLSEHTFSGDDIRGLLIPGDLARELGLTVGDSVDVFSAGGKTAVRVASIIEGEAGRFNEGRFAVAALPVAQQVLGRPGKLDSIFVIAKKGADIGPLSRNLARVAGSSTFVDSPAARVRQARTTTRTLRYGLLMGVAMALVVGGFGVFNTMNMTALERRGELATMRALGGMRGQLLRLFLGEAAFVGLAGSALGALAGIAISKRLVESIPAFFTSSVGVELGFHLPANAVAIALAAGTVVAVAAACMPSWRAVSVPPVESMKPEGAAFEETKTRGPLWAAIGVMMMAAGFVLAIIGRAGIGYMGLAALMLGAIVTSYGLMSRLAASTAWLARRFGMAGRLAAAAIERAPRRAWASSVAVVAAVGMVVGQTAITRNLNTSLNDSYKSLGIIDLYVSAEDATSFGTDILLPNEWRRDLEKIQGVANVGSDTFSFVNFLGNRVLVQGVSGSVGAEPAMAALSSKARAKVEQAEGAVVSERFEELYGFGKGETLTLNTPTGPHSVDIVGAVPSFAWERGLVTIGAGAMAEWFGRHGVSTYLLTFNKDADRSKVRAGVDEITSGFDIPVFVNSGSDYLGLIRNTVGQVNRLFDSMAAIVVGAALLGILNALLISVVERRRELGIMRAIGASRRQLRRIVAVEAGALGAVGGIAGCGLGFLAHRAAITAISKQGGLAITYEFLWYPALIALAVGIAISMLGSLEPARRAGSIDVVQAIGYE